MSSITKSEEYLRMRDYYTQREAANEKKHKNTVDNLKEQHQRELDVVQTKSSQEVDQAKERMREKLSELDLKHKKEIDSLRELYQKKVERG